MALPQEGMWDMLKNISERPTSKGQTENLENTWFAEEMNSMTFLMQSKMPYLFGKRRKPPPPPKD
jgi:hypothetical protein